MTDTEKREKVIRGLESCLRLCDYNACRECPYGDGTPCKLLHDALALLREQEPRVMTFEEIKDNMGVPVWVEYADNENWNGYGVPTSDHKAYIMIYGANAYCANYAHTHNVAWRAWSARPTEEQRKAVKWDA
jgi:hypothetical protein